MGFYSNSLEKLPVWARFFSVSSILPVPQAVDGDIWCTAWMKWPWLWGYTVSLIRDISVAVQPLGILKILFALMVKKVSDVAEMVVKPRRLALSSSSYTS